jgi:ATP-dependent DNA helicase RecG
MFDPITVEGSMYELIYSAVDQCKGAIEEVKKLVPGGLEKITYPEEALHEIITKYCPPPRLQYPGGRAGAHLR